MDRALLGGMRTMGQMGKEPVRIAAMLILFVAILLATPAGLFAQTPSVSGDLTKAATSRSARDDAAQSIPLQKIAPEHQKKVAWLLENAGVFRRLPLRVVPCDPDLYLFLVEHPDVVVNIWEVLGASQVKLKRNGPDAYQVNDQTGTTGTMQVLYRSSDLQVVYIEGVYSGPMFGHEVRTRGLMVLKSGYKREADGRCYVTSRLDAFLNVEPDSAEFLTKTFQPLVGRVADINFQQTVDFVGCLSRTAEANPQGTQRLAARLTVEPAVRDEFLRLADQAARRAAPATPARVAENPPATQR